MKHDKWTGCGISKIWGLRDDHPFKSACAWHDKEADKPGGITANDDKLFKDMMLATASRFRGTTRAWLKAQARLFYLLAVTWRKTMRSR